MHSNLCFSKYFKVFEAHVSVSGMAGSPSGRDRGFADAANEKTTVYQRFSRVAIVIPLVPHLGGGAPVRWAINPRYEKTMFFQRLSTFLASCFLSCGVLFRTPCEKTTFYNVFSTFPVTCKRRCRFTRHQPTRASTFHVI